MTGTPHTPSSGPGSEGQWPVAGAEQGGLVLRLARRLGPWAVVPIVAAAGAQVLIHGASLTQGALLALSTLGIVMLAFWFVALLREHAARSGAAGEWAAFSVEAIPLPAFVVDLERNSIICANAEAHLLLGYPPGGLSAVDVHALSPEWERARTDMGLARAARDGREELRDRPRLRLDGSIIWVDAIIRGLDYHGLPRALVVWYETTDRRASEGELARQLAALEATNQTLTTGLDEVRSAWRHYRAMFEYAGEALFIVDARDWTLLEVNQLGLQFLCASTQGVAREHLRAITADEEAELATALRSVRRSQEPVLIPAGIQRLDGKVVTALVHGHCAQVGDEELLCLCIHDSASREPLDAAIQRGHDELQRQAAELARANDQLLRSNAVKSQFLANMSHEIRTPLNAINGFAELLADESFGALTESQRGFVERISDSGQHLLQLVSDIIDLSKVEAGKVELDLEPVRVNRLVEQAAKIMRGSARSQGISIRTMADEDDPLVMADERRAKQVLFNLLSNAVKYSPEGSAVSVSVESDGDWATVRVTDEGVGIAAEDQERIFDEFVRVGPRGAHPGGAGLGLPLSRHLVHLHGGQMSVTSAMGEGSSFSFTLPVAPSQSPSGQPASISDLSATRYLQDP